MSQSRRARVDQFAADAHRFLQAFCSRLAPAVVTLVDEHGWFRLAPSIPEAAPVSIDVQDGEPTVVVGIGTPADEVILEWTADLDSYDSGWWARAVGPVLADVAAGRIREASWNRGPGHRITTPYAPWTTDT